MYIFSLVIKNPPAKAGDTALIPGPGRFPGEIKGNPFWDSCLGNPVDREDWKVTVYEVAKGRHSLATPKQQDIYIYIYIYI